MKLSNEFTVAVPLERAWETLLTLERVAGFLPGARIDSESDGGVYHGAMRVKVGPMVVDYEGTARLIDTDEIGHAAKIGVEGRDVRGRGTASAVIESRAEEVPDGTRVIAETELNITGLQAQFGRGIMQDVAERILDDFARQFEEFLTAPEDSEVEVAGEPPQATATIRDAAAPEPSEPLDIGAALWQSSVMRRSAVGVMAGMILLLVLLRRRGRLL